MSDVVAELDAWLDQPYGTTPSPRLVLEVRGTMRRVRDEIVALRKLMDGDWVWKQITDIRDEALEEAARVCEGCVSSQPRTGARECAAAIRALKKEAR